MRAGGRVGVPLLYGYLLMQWGENRTWWGSPSLCVLLAIPGGVPHLWRGGALGCGGNCRITSDLATTNKPLSLMHVVTLDCGVVVSMVGLNGWRWWFEG